MIDLNKERYAVSYACGLRGVSPAVSRWPAPGTARANLSGGLVSWVCLSRVEIRQPIRLTGQRH
jgi:hypothetical protein